MRRLLLASLIALPVAARAACPDAEAVGRLAEALLDNRPSPAFTGMTSLEDGFCAQAQLVALLRQSWGAPIGYKVGLTSAPGCGWRQGS